MGRREYAYIVQIQKIKLKWTEALGAEKNSKSINNYQELLPETDRAQIDFLSSQFRRWTQHKYPNAQVEDTELLCTQK